MTSTLALANRKSLLFVGRTLAIMALLLVESAWSQSTEKVIFNLGTNGAEGGLILDSQGNLYGTATGTRGQLGTVFEAKRLANGTWTHYVLYRFLGGSDGRNPNPGLVFDSAGNLYGTTQAGGANPCPLEPIPGCGTVFQLSPTPKDEWKEKQLYNFEGMTGNTPDGEVPSSGLVSDGAGNLYGTTLSGGAYNGTVFQLTPESNGTWTETILYRFSGGEDGLGPRGLIRDSQGNLYGSTRAAGATEGGTIFELSPNTDGAWTYHLVHKFCSRTNCSDGSGPAGIILDSQRNLYGTTSNGGLVPCPALSSSGCGTVFKLVHGTGGGWGFHLLHTFCTKNQCLDGAAPSGAPTLQSDGTLYGLTELGGTINRGTLFKLGQTSSAWVLTSLYSFCLLLPCPGGLEPGGELALDGFGNLYGTAPIGGSVGAGVVFQMVP